MSWLDMLDVAIGVTFMFLLLSLMAGAVQEMIAWALDKRSDMLEKWIRDLLLAPQGTAGQPTLLTELANEFYKHPLIDNLIKGGANVKPSYIPAETFARALIDAVIKTPVVAPAIPAGGPAPAAPPALPALPVPVPPPGSPAGSAPEHPNPPAFLTLLRNKLAQLPENDPIRALLEQMVSDAGRDAEKLKTSIENWFNGAMDRLSGWYKRWAYLCLLVIGAVITIALAVDTIEVAKYLATNQPAREMLVQNAAAFLKANESEQGAQPKTEPQPQGAAPAAPPAPAEGKQAAPPAAPAEGTPAAPPAPPAEAKPAAAPAAPAGGASSASQSSAASTPAPIICPADESTGGSPGGSGQKANPPKNAGAKGGANQETKQGPGNNLENCYRLFQNTLNQGYPIGWGSVGQRWSNVHGCWEGLKFVVQTIFGFLFTILAIAMGSNFWFGSLRDLMNLRAAGPRPPAKSNGTSAQGQQK